MNAEQLEFNLDEETEMQIQMGYLRTHIDQKCESMEKVRRKLFAEMGEVKKICLKLVNENEELKTMIREMKNEKTDWVYGEKDCLFNVREYKKTIG